MFVQYVQPNTCPYLSHLPIEILERRDHRKDLLAVAVDGGDLVVEQIEHVQRLEALQRLQFVEVLDFVARQIEMRQFGTGRQIAEAVRHAVVGQLEFAEARQRGESFECGQTDVDEAERFEGAKFVGEADNVCAAAVVQNQFGYLRGRENGLFVHYISGD